MPYSYAESLSKTLPVSEYPKIVAFVHPRFGDLSHHKAVVMPPPSWPGTYTPETPLFIHLTVTGRCNARCKGCINAAVTLGVDRPRSHLVTSQETVPERDARAVLNLVRLSPEGPVTLCFYGGEPFLVPQKMEAIVRIISKAPEARRIRYLVYTNGMLLDRALDEHPWLMERIWLYSVSIDGDESQHNRIRRGTRLSQIVANLERLKSLVPGRVLQWSTLREDQSLLRCFEQFMELYDKGLADYFFWHWVETPDPLEDLVGYGLRYEKDFSQVLDIYLDYLEQGRILPIIHLNELILYALSGRQRGHTACGVELARNFDLVDGRIHACADLPPEWSLGSVADDGSLIFKAPPDLKSLVGYREGLGCGRCGVLAYCGGRCPVQALTGSPERTLQYCQLIRLHIALVLERLPRIAQALKRAGLGLQELYEHSAFLAPYTDVVP
ncbi:radical SAM protein [Thermosulfuriphilus sp.]